MRGIVYIAAKPLADNEELFVDYRLNPFAGPLPTWYTPFDSEGANRRWYDEDGKSSASTSDSNGSGDDAKKVPDDADDLLFRDRRK